MGVPYSIKKALSSWDSAFFCSLLAFEAAQCIQSKGLGPVQVQVFPRFRSMHVLVLVRPGDVRPDDAAARPEEFYGTAQVLGGLVRIGIVVERGKDGDVVVADFLQRFLPLPLTALIVYLLH